MVKKAIDKQQLVLRALIGAAIAAGAVVVFAVTMLLVFLMPSILNGAFFEKHIQGDHFTGGSYARGIPANPRFDSLEEAYKEYDIEKTSIVHIFSNENYMVVLVQETSSFNGESCQIKGYEFYYDGTYSLMGDTTLLFSDSNEYGNEVTLRQDLQNFLGMPHLSFLRLAELYGALPAWGVADGDWIYDIVIDGQSIDEIVPLECHGKVYYLWIILDLQTRNRAAEVLITGIN